MGETLTIASQKRAYTLSDRGTFLATKNLDAKVLVEGGAALLNPYHVIVVRHEGTNAGCAKDFSDWISSARRSARSRGSASPSTASRCSSRTRRADGSGR